MTDLMWHFAEVSDIERANEDPGQWTARYREYAKANPCGTAVAQAQDYMRRVFADTVYKPMPPYGKVADHVIVTMLRRGGHPLADTGFAGYHPHPDQGESRTVESAQKVGVALHPSRWDYGTAGHEVAHLCQAGSKNSDIAVHGPTFVNAYMKQLAMLDDRAPAAFRQQYIAAYKRILDAINDGA
jgi:hypothetical protein